MLPWVMHAHHSLVPTAGIMITTRRQRYGIPEDGNPAARRNSFLFLGLCGWKSSAFLSVSRNSREEQLRAEPKSMKSL